MGLPLPLLQGAHRGWTTQPKPLQEVWTPCVGVVEGEALAQTTVDEAEATHPCASARGMEGVCFHPLPFIGVYD